MNVVLKTMDGIVVSENTARHGKTEFDVSDLEAGIYFVVITDIEEDAGKPYVKKLIIR